MKLKDKKIEIMEEQYVSDKYGNQVKQTVTIATVWAYFRFMKAIKETELCTASGRNDG